MCIHLNPFNYSNNKNIDLLKVNFLVKNKLTSSSKFSKEVIFREMSWPSKWCFCCCFANRAPLSFSAEHGLSFEYIFDQIANFKRAVAAIILKKVPKKAWFWQKRPLFWQKLHKNGTIYAEFCHIYKKDPNIRPKTNKLVVKFDKNWITIQ